MERHEIVQLFEQQAAHYDRQWEKMAPINDGLYFLLQTLLLRLPADAKILAVGAGTGKEVRFLAQRFPGWQFTVVEPSDAMMAICRETLAADGCASRCHFHQGYLDSLPDEAKHHAATCFNVSHFILDPGKRTEFFAGIGRRLSADGLLVSCDLCFDTDCENYQPLLDLWLALMSNADISDENIERMKAAYAKDVAILPVETIKALLKTAGFDLPTCFYQAGLIAAFFARKTA